MNKNHLFNFFRLDVAKLEKWQLEQFPPQKIKALNQKPLPTCIERGEEAIIKGEVACLILAGGAGTRLGFDGPKGIFPLDQEGTTLFKIHLQRIAKINSSLPVAIMCSPRNAQETRKYLAAQDYFGMEPSALSFFIQGTLPYLDEEGYLFLESSGKVVEGPDGNGYALHKLVESGIYSIWKERGIKTVHLILIDNALSHPFDPGLIGAHLKACNQVTLKTIPRIDPEEKVGVLVQLGDKIGVVEYSELGEDVKDIAQFPYANISLFAFEMQFIEQVADKPLPMHRAYKKMKETEKMGWKLESFIFDLLLYSEKTGFIVEEREKTFAPLKEAFGPFGPQAVLKNLRRC